MWTYVLLERTATLHSMGCTGMRDCPWADSPKDWVRASCNLNDYPWHTAPDEECSCGIYAVPTVDELLMHFAPGVSGDGTGQVMGRVELAGKIIEHDRGFRAERARLVELVPLGDPNVYLMLLGTRLRLPLARPEPRPEMSPLDMQILKQVSTGATTGEVSASSGLGKGEVSRRIERILRFLHMDPINPPLSFWPPDRAA